MADSCELMARGGAPDMLMTQAQAEKAANLVIGVAAVGAAYLILRNPPLRRMVWRLARTALATTAPALMTEARRAWAEGSTRQHGI